MQIRGDPHPAAEAVEAEHPGRRQRKGQRRAEHHAAGVSVRRERVVQRELVDPERGASEVLDDRRDGDDPVGGLEDRPESLLPGRAQHRRETEGYQAESGVDLERRRLTHRRASSSRSSTDPVRETAPSSTTAAPSDRPMATFAFLSPAETAGGG